MKWQQHYTDMSLSDICTHGKHLILLLVPAESEGRADSRAEAPPVRPQRHKGLLTVKHHIWLHV